MATYSLESFVALLVGKTLGKLCLFCPPQTLTGFDRQVNIHIYLYIERNTPLVYSR